jgi:hypothetical protein
LHKFSNEDHFETRGFVVISKNQNTKEIISVSIEENNKTREDMASVLTQKCESNSLY